MKYKDNENILMKKFCVFKYLLYLCTAFKESTFGCKTDLTGSVGEWLKPPVC